MLGEDDARGLTLVAGYQEHGAGRKGRSWIAPPGSALLCTIALPDPLPARDLWAVPFWAALVVERAARSFGVETRLQWPNDVLIGTRKVSGILCISRVTGDYAWAACGIGVNVQRPRDESSLAAIDPPPVFLSDVAQVDRLEFLHELLAGADALYDDLSAPLSVLHAWERAAKIPGMLYRIAMDGENEPFDATALRLLPGGTLVVEANGAQREVSLADARVLRK